MMANQSEIEMDEHMKAMWAGKSNVLVAVRVRPLMKHDQVKKGCVRTLDTNVVVIMDPAAGDKADILRANRSREKQYAFDYVFEQKSTQENTYLHTAKFLIHGVLDGFNATVFAYGQTGSGKTYTMIGSESEPGIMVRVMEDLFRASGNQARAQGQQFKISVSFLEVYNENIRDLLSDVEEYLDLREDPIKGPVVSSITEIETTSSQEIMGLLHQGNAKRSQAATAANEVSSRSHAVLQVVVESSDRAPGAVANIKVGKLSLVDLAGSERAANTKNVGARLVEGANINRSLLALGNCINALGEKGNKGNFVPYRDSKLTRLLKDSLGGNCRTVMIANISSAESSFEETLNTLKYANRAKNIKTHVQRNVLNVNYHISEYVQLINNLRGEIQQLKGQISSTGAPGPSMPGSSHGRMPQLDPRILAQGPRLDMDAPLGLQPGQRSPLLHGRGGAPSTPFQALRESMRSATGGAGGEGRELVNNMRQRIVENFQERMQLRRSLIELEDQNVQNSIEVSKRQLIVVQWSETHGTAHKGPNAENLTKADFAADIIANGSTDIVEAWQECEQLRKAIMKNNGMKKNIAKRLRHNEKEAEHFRDELGDKITGEDRRELMELQYQVGRLELENMELEQHRIVHESILKGKDLEIQKLKLQLAVRDKLIHRQQNVLVAHSLDDKVGYHQLALMEQTLMDDSDALMPPPSPPRNMSDMAQPSSADPRFSFAGPEGGGRGGGGGGGGADPGNNGSNAGIATNAQGAGRRKVNPAVSNGAAAGSGAGGNAGPRRTVPKLKINAGPSSNAHDRASNLPVVDSDEEDMQYEYSIPLSERETLLTARDRDLIEQGDWSEIHSELSDNDSSLLVGAGRHSFVRNTHHSMISSLQQAQGGSGSAVVGAGGKPQGGGVQGPRGGRQFRSSAAAEELGAAGGNAPVRPAAQHNFKVHSGGFQIEDSDEDSVSNKDARAKRSPRSHVPRIDRLDPIPMLANADDGVLSGRRYSNLSARRGEASNQPSVNPRGNDVGAGAAAPAFAPIYPSLAGKERQDKEGASKFNHVVTGHGHGGVITGPHHNPLLGPSHNGQGQGQGQGGNYNLNAKLQEDWNFAEEARKESHNKHTGAAVAQAPANPRHHRNNSREQLEIFGAAGAVAGDDAIDSAHGGGGVRTKAGALSRNAALGRLKAHGPPAPTANGAGSVGSAINNENSDFSLNVYGNGFGDQKHQGGLPVQGAPLAPGPGDVASVRPSIRNKRVSSKIKQQPQAQAPQGQAQGPSADTLEGLIIDGMGELGARMRSLPNLGKQNEGNLSAR